MIEKTQIKDLPDELTGRIQKEIQPYEVILLDPDIKEGEIPALASGTLVQMEDQHFILTAKHVSDELSKLDEMGLNLGTDEHRFTIDTSGLRVVDVEEQGQGVTDIDLALIKLPHSQIGRVSVTKTFWDLSKHKEPVLSQPLDWNNALFLLCGTIGEWAEIENSEGQFSKILNCRCEFMPTGVRKYNCKGRFDYLNLGVSYRNRTDLPESFRGASGGGIWGTQLRRTQDGGIAYSSPILVGMAFKQDERINGSRSVITGITGYGPRTIYEQAAGKIRGG